MAAFQRGIDLLNRQEYFEAHEVLEDVWRAAPSAHKRFLQGLVQVAVAFHHYTHANTTGAQSVLRRAINNLSADRPPYATFDVDGLLALLCAWERVIIGISTVIPAAPNIQLSPQQSGQG